MLLTLFFLDTAFAEGTNIKLLCNTMLFNLIEIILNESVSSSHDMFFTKWNIPHVFFWFSLSFKNNMAHQQAALPFFRK